MNIKERETLAAASIALAATCLAAFLCWRVFELVPHIADAIAYAFQGRILASGRLFLPPPPLPQAFEVPSVILTATRWTGKYTPGLPLLLAPGYLLGVPWLVNPILLGVSVFGVFRLGRALFDGRTGLMGAALLALSPFSLLMGASFMAHVATLGAAVWCLVAMTQADAGRPRAAVIAGALGSFAFVCRPYSAAVLLAPAVAWFLWRKRADRAWLSTLLRLALGAAGPLALFLAYNSLVWGSPFRTGYGLDNPTETFTGNFGESLPLGTLFAKNLPFYLYDLNRSLWGWPWPDLLPLLFLVRKQAGRRKDLLLLACAAALVLGYSFYYFYNINFSGPRYAFEALGPLSLLVARGLLSACELLESILANVRAPGLYMPTAATAAVLLVAFPLAGRLPEQARALSHAYHGHTRKPIAMAKAAGVGEDALIFVSGSIPLFNYSSFFLENALDPRKSRCLYVRDLPLLRDALVATFPREEVWNVSVDLRPIPHPNVYVDNTWELKDVVWTRLR
jgi:hypothetical protein